MQESQPSRQPDEVVTVRGAGWRLIERQPFDRCALLTLQGLDGGNLGETLRILEPFDRIARGGRGRRWTRAGRRAAARHAAAIVARTHPWHGCWTAAGAALDLHSWQLEPVLALLRGATRLLLADGVGLGKTIQAGLILSELSARGLAAHALILTPAGLRAQWADELRRRFALHATVLDQAALLREAANLPVGASPWAASPIVISSIDLAKRAETRPALDRLPLDLLIVDEAHHLTPDSDRGALVERLARRTPWLVLISATPHSGDVRAFRYLHALGATAADQLTIFRRSTAAPAQARRTRLVALRCTPHEERLLAAVQRYARAIWQGNGAGGTAARLVAIVLTRRAASSAEALLVSLRRRRALLGVPDRGAPAQPHLPWEEHDAGDAPDDDGVLAAPGLPDADDERRQLDGLIALAAAATSTASKATWLARLIDRTREPLLIFSEFRDTIEALHERLADRVTLAVLHGGLPPSRRRDATAAFISGACRVLLATDAAGEGLNLHARCRAVINVELPWNPLRLEQRIGRVDRMGQTRRVHAWHLTHADSIEDAVLAHLRERLTRVYDAMTPAEDDDLELRMAAAVLGDTPVRLSLPPLAAHSTSPAARAEAQRLLAIRRLGQPRASPAARVPVSLPRRRAAPPESALFVLNANLSDRTGRPAGGIVVPACLTLARAAGPPLDLDAVRAMAAAVADSSSARERIAAGLAEQRHARGSFVDAVRARVQALRQLIAADRGAPFQPALFDGRATRAALDRHVVLDLHRAHLTQLAAAFGDGTGHDGELQADAPRVTAAWLPQ